LRNRFKIIVLLFSLLCWIFTLVNGVQAASFFDRFIDPYDGKFDTSNWLLKHKGFLPVPIIITEPAVGYGGGATLLFFHPQEEEPNQEKSRDTGKKKPLPPSISGIMGLATENDTWVFGGFHSGNWKKDHIRYTGALFYPSVNLTFYGGGDTPIFDNGLDYNLEGWLLFQKILFRIKETNFFLGPKLLYYNIDSEFKLMAPVDTWQLNLESYGLGLHATYDSRDNIFTPNSGIKADISTTFFRVENDSTGSRDYQLTDAASKIYWQLFPDIVLGWRMHGGFGSGDLPFFALPHIDLRGIPAMNYQGENILVTEVETRWNVNERWSLVFFGGGGRAADSLGDFSESDNKWAGGTGFRYLMARMLGLYTGVDIAWGPDDHAVYLQVGSAWGK
jgi:hypothetical protein